MGKVSSSSGPDSTKNDADKVTISDLQRSRGGSDVAGTMFLLSTLLCLSL